MAYAITPSTTAFDATQSVTTQFGPVRAWQALPDFVHFIITALVVALIVGLVVNYLFDLWSGVTKVRLVTSTKGLDYTAFLELYEELIEANDQVTADRIGRYVSLRQSSPCSLRGLRRRLIKRPARVHHLLFVAASGRRRVGFLKAIVCDDANSVFIAYLGSKDTEATTYLVRHLSRKVLRSVPAAVTRCPWLTGRRSSALGSQSAGPATPTSRRFPRMDPTSLAMIKA